MCCIGSVVSALIDYFNFSIGSDWFRKACLKYGAGIVYNGKDGRTKDTLLKYIIHKAYGLPFAGKANIAERDCVFIPAGRT